MEQEIDSNQMAQENDENVQENETEFIQYAKIETANLKTIEVVLDFPQFIKI